MKKILKSFMLLLTAASALTVASCSDDDNNSAGTNTNREFMTMFICDNTRGKGTDYPYNSGLDGAYPHGNTIHLYWYGVNDCAGYQIQMGLQIKVSGGAEAWRNVQGTSDLLLDTIVGPKQLDLLLKDLQYSTNYRFAIRALSKLDRNIKGDESTFAHASNWYGHGNGRQWQEYLGITTNDRYATPTAIYVNQAQTTETEMYVYLNQTPKSALGYAEDAEITDEDDLDKLESYTTNFNVGEDGKFAYKYLTVTPSPNNPNSTVDPDFVRYEITEADREAGVIKVTGLTPNSVYVIDVIDPTVPVAIDAKYNTCTARSDGQPGAPIVLSHDSLMATMGSLKIRDHESVDYAECFAKAYDFDAAPLTPTLYDFISDTKYAEGQTFELEGGKTYFLQGNDITCKGFVLRTRPEDVARGLRARVISGIGNNSEVFNQAIEGRQWDGCPYSMFTFGRSPEAGEGGEVYMKKLAFYDIDFDNPLCYNWGDQKAGAGSATGNYFFNMFSDGMAITLDSLVIENCTFKRIVRGFVREQGPNYKRWNHVVIKNNQFYDCGYYSNGAGGYCWIDGAGNNGKTNMLADLKVTDNTFYDSPFPAFIKQQLGDQYRYEGDATWNITFSNNTLVNYNTRGDGAIFKVSRIPDGSEFNVQNNLIVLCKQAADVRQMQMFGVQIVGETGTENRSDGSSGQCKLNFSNNWSTNDFLTNGSVFSGRAFDNKKDGFQFLIDNQKATLEGTLEVKVADISATDLFVSPCPPHIAATAEDQNMHRADALDGTATSIYNVNLFFKNTDNEIYNNNVGAAYWRR